VEGAEGAGALMGVDGVGLGMPGLGRGGIISAYKKNGVKQIKKSATILTGLFP